MKLVLTRPYYDSVEFKKLLEQESSGFSFIIEPMLEIKFLQKDVDVRQENIFLITSVNSVRALAKNTESRSMHLVTVGNSSAKEAVGLGFTNVKCATDELPDLFGEEAMIEYIKRNVSSGSKLLHISANITKGGIKNELKKLGHDIDTIILYKSKKKEMSADLLGRINNEESLGFIFFSPRTAAIFVSELKENNLENKLRNSFAFCFSGNVLKALNGIEFKNRLTATKVNTKEFVELIKSYGRV